MRRDARPHWVVLALFAASCTSLGPGAEPTQGDVYLPSRVGEIELTLRTADPAYYAAPPPRLTPGQPGVWENILGSLGKSWSDVRFVGGAKNESADLGVYATQVSAADDAELLEAYRTAMGSTFDRQPVSFERRSIDGRAVLVSTVGFLYAYATNGTLYEISAVNEAMALAALETLP